MSDQPIYTPEEQLKLRELEAQSQGISNFKNAVTRSLHCGQDSAIIANLLQFLSDLISQTVQQIEQIKIGAQSRSKEAPAKESK